MSDGDDISISGNTIQGGDYSSNFQQNIGINYGTIYFGGRAVETAPAPENRIFLSYGRDDDDPDHRDPDKSFMRRLYRDLSAEGYQVWWDRETMPSRALTFLQEIRDAITPCRRLILVVGESAMKSAHVSAEWQYALSQCIPVIPILRSGDYDLLPSSLRLIHTPDFRDDAQYAPALAELKRILGEPDAKLATLYGVPPLPDAYIERDAFQSARELVLSDSEKAVVVTSQKQQTTTLHGVGGIGKSTLAAALSRSCEVRRAFPDGVFWIEVGKKPDILTRLGDIGAVFGDPREEYPDETRAKQRLSYLLAKKRALIVLDDVWEHQHAQAFSVADASCRLLITTRQGGMVTKLNAQGQPLDNLTPDEALELVAARLEIPAEALPPECAEMVSILGEHTLAVSLAAASLAERGLDYAPRLLQRLQEGKMFKALKLGEDDKNLNLEKCLLLSYEDLNDDLKRRFRATGIFAPGSSFDEAAAQAIWNDDDPDDSDDALNELARAGLTQRSDGNRYSQHGLLRAYARALLESAGETETIFNHYADYMTGIAALFDELQPEDWGQLTPHLPHIHAVGDGLVHRFARLPPLGAGLRPARIDPVPTETNDADTALLQRTGDFAWNVMRYVNNRPQMIEINGQRVLRGLNWMEMGLAVYRQQGNQGREATTLNNIGGAWDALGEQRKALEYYEQALPLDRAMGDRGGEATTLNNIGMAWSDLGEKRKALDFYEQALPLRRAVGDRGGEAITLNNIGLAWDALGEQRKALDFYEQALPLRRAVGDRGGEATTLNNIGMAWSDLGEQRKALDFYEQALPILQAVGNRSVEATTLNNTGGAWSALGEKRKALDYYEQALPLSRAVGDRRGEGYTLNNMAHIYEFLGDFNQAITCAEQCTTLLDAIEDVNAGHARSNLERLKRQRDGGEGKKRPGLFSRLFGRK